MTSLVLHLSLTSLLVPLFNFSFSNTYYIPLHIFLYLLLSLTTSNLLSPTPLSSISLYVLLLAHYSITKLSQLSIPYPLTYISFSPSTCHLSPLNTFTPVVVATTSQDD